MLKSVRVGDKHIESIQRYLEWLANVCLGALFIWKGLWSGWRALGSDFPQYYMGARLLLEHYNLDRIYDWIWLQRIADRFGVSHQLVGYSGLTPFCAFPLLPFAWLPILQAKHVWQLLNVVLLIGIVYALSRSTGVPLRRTWLIALLAIIPLRTDITLGQMHLVVLALLVAAWRLHIRGKQIASGCCIALAGALKIYPLFFCFYFLIKKRWRALGTAVAATAGCIALSWAIFGKGATTTYFSRQLPRLLSGEAVSPFAAGMSSASVMFHRLFVFDPELNPHPLVSSPLLFAAGYSLWQSILTGLALSGLRSGDSTESRESLEWCVFLTLLMFLSSAPSTYHFVALTCIAVPTYSILDKVMPKWKWVFLALYALACNGRNIANAGLLPPSLEPILVPRLWAGVGLIALYALLLNSRELLAWDAVEGSTNRAANLVAEHDCRIRNRVAIGGVVAALWLIGTAVTWSHVTTLESINARKLMVADEALMRTNPMITTHGLYYIGMLSSQYALLRNGIEVLGAAEGDELAYAVNHEGTRAWIESASGGGSVVTEVWLSEKTQSSCVIDDAESPVLSQNEASLAFIRETRGRGSLWITDAQNCNSVRQPMRVTSAGVDVRSVSGASLGGFVFSALTEQGPGVFFVSRDSRPELIFKPRGPVGSVVMLADRQTLILSEQISGTSQLITVNLVTKTVQELTSGSCNSEAPVWKDENQLLYATDCGRGMGLTTLAEMTLNH